MYSVETEEVAVQQVAALPAEALPFYAELMTVLEITPWSGEAYNRQRPDVTCAIMFSVSTARAWRII